MQFSYRHVRRVVVSEGRSIGNSTWQHVLLRFGKTGLLHSEGNQANLHRLLRVSPPCSHLTHVPPRRIKEVDVLTWKRDWLLLKEVSGKFLGVEKNLEVYRDGKLEEEAALWRTRLSERYVWTASHVILVPLTHPPRATGDLPLFLIRIWRLSGAVRLSLC